jgi:hypothetical protein
VINERCAREAQCTVKTSATARDEGLRQNGLSECEGFVLDKAEYFPIDAEAVGNRFVFHERHLV